MESISKIPSLKTKFYFWGKNIPWLHDPQIRRVPTSFLPLHLKGQPPLQDSTYATQTWIELTSKRAWSCLPATQKTWIFRHQGIWVKKQTDRQHCYILPLEIKTKQSNGPAWPSCFAAVTLDTESLLYKNRGKQQGRERNIQHGGWDVQRVGGGRRQKSVLK